VSKARWSVGFRSLAPTTRQSYQKQVLEFVSWARSRGENIGDLDAVDPLVADYLEERFEEGASRQGGHNLINGLGHFVPQLRGRLPVSRWQMRGWDREKPAQPWPPLTWECALAIAVQLTKCGHFAEGVAVLLMHRGIMRISEVAGKNGLTTADVTFTGDRRLGAALARKVAALRLRHTKTKKNLWVEITDPDVIQVLRVYMNTRTTDLGDDDKLFPFSIGTLRRRFHSACETLGLRGYVPHSCRHGGATDLFNRTENIERVLIAGRWASTKSARHYVQSGRALLLSARIPQRTADLGTAFAADVVGSFRAALELSSRRGA
jgi:hypothetical protein